MAVFALLPSLSLGVASAPPAWATHAGPGGVFVTGHDPDFHAFRGGNTEGARNIIRRAVSYVTFGHPNPQMLLVTDLRDPGSGFSDPRLGVSAAGFTYDVADFGSGASGVRDLRTVDFATYDVIVVASDYGGWLRQDELTILNARGEELRRYVNAGGGLVVLSQGGNNRLTTCCEFGFLPFLVTSTALGQNEAGYTVTPAGAAMGLTNSDINGNASHLHFTAAGGMEVINVDASGRRLSLATRGNFIGDDGIKPAISISDVTVNEGDSGTVAAVFTVRLSQPDPQDVVTVRYATADDTATAGSDYEVAAGTLRFEIGETTKTISVAVVGDSRFEPDERFVVSLSDPAEAGITDGQGVATIVNDDQANQPPIARIGGSYSVPEGGSLVLDARGSIDPDGDALTFFWQVEGEDVVVQIYDGPTRPFSAAGRDGPSVVAVQLRVCDPLGACAEDATSVAVTNVAPTVDAGPDRTAFRGETLSLAGTYTDPAGALDEPYAFAWNVPGQPSSGTALYGATLSRTASFSAEGTYVLALAVTDKDGGRGSESLVVTVLNRPPDCSAAAPTVSTLWPPNHRLVDVGVAGLTDADGDSVAVSVTSIRQDEAVDAKGSGNTAPDGGGVGTATAQLRAERAGGGDGRVYHVGFRAADGHGGSCAGVVRVAVPHDQSGRPAVDGGPLYDSTAT